MRVVFFAPWQGAVAPLCGVMAPLPSSLADDAVFLQSDGVEEVFKMGKEVDTKEIDLLKKWQQKY